MQRSLRLLAASVIFVATAGFALSLIGKDNPSTAPKPPAATVEVDPVPSTTGTIAGAPPPPDRRAETAPVATLAQTLQSAVPETREQIKLSFSPIVKRVAPAVVNVYATSRVRVRSPFAGDPFFERFFGSGDPFGGARERTRSSLGSGVIVDPSGAIVTNNHVIGDATDVKVALSDGREYPAKILLKDERTDLAVLKIDNGGEAFPVLGFGDSDKLEVGDLVLALGDPFGVGQTVTSGIVSAVARTNVGINDSGFFIQTDAAINPGNSGGALVDLDGALIGINTAIFSQSGGSIGIGFAIPSNMVKTVVAQAVAGSTSVARPWIGVDCQDVTQDIAASLGLASPHGALITHIDDDSPASKAGLKIGDLIVKVAGGNIGDTTAFNYRLAVAGIGSPVALEVLRDGETLPLTVTAEGEPQLDEADLTLIGGRGPLTGAVVADLSSSLADRMNIRGVEKGAVIVDVEPMSPADRVGFKAGDVVITLQGKDVGNARQLADIAEKEGRLWRIKFNRGGRVSSVVIGG